MSDKRECAAVGTETADAAAGGKATGANVGTGEASVVAEPEAANAAASATTGAVADSKKTPRMPSVSRRGVLCGAIGAAAVLALGGVRYLPSEALVRPPGAQDENRLLAECIRCQKCLEICPQNAISISHVEDGFLQARTPKMDFRQGFCNFCENVEGGPLCARACPTNAIKKIETQTVNIGIAQLTREWCLAYRGMGCHSCQDVCEYDAITLDSSHVPVVDTDKCNGCGACENACISLSSGSLSGTWDASAPTDRAITIKPL